MTTILRKLRIQARLWLLLLISVITMTTLGVLAIQQLHASKLAEKETKTRHLVESAHSLIDHYYQLAQQGHLSQSAAQQAALDALRTMRYERQEYFWVNDMQAVVLMHPIKPALVGRDMKSLQDPNGKYIFREFVDIVSRHGEGMVPYLWPKPGSETPVDKLSYVKGFTPWGWIVGSGIYLDDVEAQSWQDAKLFGSVVLASLLITLLASYLISNSIIQPLCRTAAAMRDISQGEGDLTRRLNDAGNDELAELSHSFNHFVDQIHTVVREVDGSTRQVAAAAEQLAAVTRQTSAVIERQSRETDQVAAAINQMTATVQEVANNAGQAADAAQQADQEAHSGKTLINRTNDSISAMSNEVQSAAEVLSKLEAHTKGISSVLDVIGDIAEQTNLLALNAAIEAARAGEAGRGFAVVADEVRTLASRTQQSTLEIEQMIEQLQQGAREAVQVMEGSRTYTDATVEQARQTGGSLEAIIQAMGTASDMVTQIASAAEQQSAVADEINRNITNIVRLTEETSESALQTTDASNALASLAEQLKGLVMRFKV